MRKRLKDLNVAEVACFLRDERLKVFVDMVVEEEVRSGDIRESYDDDVTLIKPHT